MKPSDIPYGPIYVVRGIHAGRIGYYDDAGYDSSDLDSEDDASDQEDEDIRVAYVYFGDFFLADGYFVIPLKFLREVTTDDLMRRREELSNLCGMFAKVRQPRVKISQKEKVKVLTELHYVDGVLVDRMIQARYVNLTQGKKVFISHSSRDKSFAIWLGTDLKAAGHTPWFDEWDIRVGESIPQKISEGLKSADFAIVVLSEYAVESRWVEREWHAKYWSEVESGHIQVLPLLLRDCAIPELLKTKKYADFRESYNNGFEDVLLAIDALSKSKEN